MQSLGAGGVLAGALFLSASVVLVASPSDGARPADAAASPPVAPSPEAAPGSSSLSPRELVPLLTRSGVGPELTIIDVTYAPPLFFEVTGIPMPPEMESRPTLAFMLQESVHEGELPGDAPEPFLLLPDGARIAPYDARVTAEDDHHRVSRLLFGSPEGWPEAHEDESGMVVLRLIVPNRDGTFSVGNTFEWSLPIDPDGQSASGGEQGRG